MTNLSKSEEPLMSNAFAESRNLFTMYTGYVRPLSFDEWSKLPDSHKSAVLFVQFYDEITLAWYKLSSVYTYVPDEDGVSTVCQYLEKNVSKILEKPARFNAPYIYQVAYNCLYCITHDPIKPRERFFNETSNITCSENGDELDLFDTVKSLSAEQTFEEETYKKMFWQVIEDMGLETQKVVNYLLNNDSLKKVSKLSKNYASDPLRDVEVGLDQVDEIVTKLRERLAAFRR